MYPFHRKHASPGSTRASSSNQRGCSRFVDKKEDSESLTDSSHGYHHSSLQESVDYSNSNPRSYPKKHLQKALREREDALISSIKNSSDYKRNDNRIRLGPSKLNTFQCLKDKQNSTENNLDVEEKKSNITPDIITRFKEENYEFLENISDCDITKTTLKSEIVENKKDISKQNEISDKIFITDESNLASDNICSQDNITFKETDSSNEAAENYSFVTNTVLENSITNLQETENSKSEEPSQEIVQETKSNENNSSQNGNSKYCSIHKSNRSLETTKLTREKKKKVEVIPTIKEKVKTYLNENHVLIEEKGFSTDKFIPVSPEMIILLKKLIFYSENSSVAYQWLGQSFVFSQNKNFKYGLIQNKRGPSGILATVQAFILKALLFDPDTATVCPHPFCPTTREINMSLIHALSNILWQAGQKKCGVIVRCNEKEDASNSDLFSGLECQKFTKLASLQAAIEKNINQFISSSRNGCFLFMVSVILSSGIKNVAADINDEVYSLTGSNGLCSLELVTLLLTGHAVSNVFDNSMLMDTYLFHGVSKRSDVGFLSIQEHFKIFQVGSNLKTPKYPIWIVNSENHFTVIYSDNMKLVSDWRAERQFCIRHYDSMQNGSEEVKLTIDTTEFYIKERTEEEYVPPLELCLRTKWKDAAFSWN
ncbi:putative ubiquitin carboxyl-terminal hydrolase MINDY-4 [Lycorma delicatula]|uniref:putative ubiquitin carboxyl-terminal hydrolase MINDY-4 n=1 Tax=Lycorma delicatula TaxID=130591 RepID=UPI003F519F5F